MKASPKLIAVTLLGFLTWSSGPFGMFWAPASDMPTPGAQLPLFMLLGAVEALALGLSVSFLLFGYSGLKMNAAVSPSLAGGPISRSLGLSATPKTRPA